MYIVLRKQSDHGTLTMYFADHKLLTFKYLNHGPILHLEWQSADGFSGIPTDSDSLPCDVKTEPAKTEQKKIEQV